MPYTDFNLTQAENAFNLIESRGTLFNQITPVSISHWLTEALGIGLALALATASEKARSEFIIAPILLKLEQNNHATLAIYSGERHDVDKEKGLSGECDFILSKGAMTHAIQAPIFALVEAKKIIFHLG